MADREARFLVAVPEAGLRVGVWSVRELRDCLTDMAKDGYDLNDVTVTPWNH